MTIKFQTRFCVILIVSILFCPGIKAQEPEVAWTASYGGGGNDYVDWVVQTYDGGYLLAGYSTSFGGGNFDIYVVKTDSDGDTAWTRVFGTEETADFAYGATQTTDGGYAIAGQGCANLIRLDANGDSLWARDYGIIASSIRQAFDGGFILAGGGLYGFCLVKTDSLGNETWRSLFPNGDGSAAMSVLQLPDGGYIAGGLTHTQVNCWDYYLVRTDADGDSLWVRTYGTYPGIPEEGYAVCQAEDGGFIMTGLSFWTVKANAQGDSIWAYYCAENADGCAYSIVPIADGYVLGGFGSSYGSNDFVMVKIDFSGNRKWQVSAGTPRWDIGYCAEPTMDGGYIMAGFTESPDGDMDAMLVKFLPESGTGDGTTLLPGAVSLLQNNPNPFNSSSVIEFSLAEQAFVRLNIYDVIGSFVATLFEGPGQAGWNSATWNAGDVSSGIYFARLETKREMKTIKMVLLK